MAPGTQRILKRRGRLVLAETTNPLTGVNFVLRRGNITVWSGESLEEAERQFVQASGA